jgi:hypothetical protein
MVVLSYLQIVQPICFRAFRCVRRFRRLMCSHLFQRVPNLKELHVMRELDSVYLRCVNGPDTRREHGEQSLRRSKFAIL